MCYYSYKAEIRQRENTYIVAQLAELSFPIVFQTKLECCQHNEVTLHTPTHNSISCCSTVGIVL